MKSKIFIYVLIAFCLLMGFVVSAHSAESKPVSCYVGNPADYQSLGDVESVNVSNAASLYNNVFNVRSGYCLMK